MAVFVKNRFLQQSHSLVDMQRKGLQAFFEAQKLAFDRWQEMVRTQTEILLRIEEASPLLFDRQPINEDQPEEKAEAKEQRKVAMR
jgi:hypothetical protein